MRICSNDEESSEFVFYWMFLKMVKEWYILEISDWEDDLFWDNSEYIDSIENEDLDIDKPKRKRKLLILLNCN